jgi:Zn-dependent peptidase ImmA (M78 family)
LTAVQARINVAVLIAQRLITAGVEIDQPLYVPDPGEFAPDEPEHAAFAMRRHWHLPSGRIDDLTSLIEAAAGVVLRIDFGTDDASAAFVPSSDGRLWFLVNTREFAGDRIRLSLAHELGHAVLHRMLPSNDELAFERQAFSFATALLLPPDHFDHAVPYDRLTLTDARRLKRAFGVSMQAIIRAAYERERIGKGRYTSLFKQLSARQWRTNEPDPIAIEQPELWDAVLRVHRDDHGYADEDLAQIARVSPALLGDLFPESFRRRRTLRVVSSNGSTPDPHRPSHGAPGTTAGVAPFHPA